MGTRKLLTLSFQPGCARDERRPGSHLGENAKAQSEKCCLDIGRHVCSHATSMPIRGPSGTTILRLQLLTDLSILSLKTHTSAQLLSNRSPTNSVEQLSCVSLSSLPPQCLLLLRSTRALYRWKMETPRALGFCRKGRARPDSATVRVRHKTIKPALTRRPGVNLYTANQQAYTYQYGRSFDITGTTVTGSNGKRRPAASSSIRRKLTLHFLPHRRLLSPRLQE